MFTSVVFDVDAWEEIDVYGFEFSFSHLNHLFIVWTTSVKKFSLFQSVEQIPVLSIVVIGFAKCLVQ